MHEIRAGLWVRNGQTIRHLVNFYRSPRFAGQTFDLDLHGLQVAFARRCSKSGGCGEVLEALFGASRTTQLDGLWLSREDSNEEDDVDLDRQIHMIESFLSTLLSIVGFTKFTTVELDYKLKAHFLI